MTDLPQSLPQAWRPPMGWNSWDSYGTTLTEDELLANARFMAEHLKNAGWDTLVIDIDWYDPTARAHGYNDNAPLILDEYGRQLPDPVRFPSAAGGKGFGPLAAAVHELGLKLGMHMMRGIPRIAVDKNLPVYGTNYTAKDVADLDHVCKWNPDNYGLNQSHPGAQAWYDAQLDLFASWGLDFLKVDDMQTPFHSDEIAAYHRAIAKAEAKYGRSIDLSLSPGGWVATSYVDFLRENAQMWRISDDLWDRWEDIYQQFARLARWAPFQTTGHWADADMLPLGHIGLRAERGAVVADKTVLKMMGEMGLRCGIRRETDYHRYNSYRGVVGRTFENVIARDFDAGAPWRKLGTDVTEFKVAGGKAYWAPTLDFCTKEIVASDISTTPDMSQQARMLDELLPKIPEGAAPTMHSDRGWQYQHASYTSRLEAAGIVQSMSRKANCIDNAATEQLFGHVKDEFYRGREWKTFEDFKRDLEEYIVHWNTSRRQVRLKGLTPEEFRNQALAA